MELSENAIKVLRSRYLRKDKAGNFIETPAQLFFRVAKSIAQAELNYGNVDNVNYWEEKFSHLLSELHFVPNSPTLMNAGSPLGQLSACFVLPVEDSMDGIFSTLRNTALIQQSGGGTGFNFSKLRPTGDYVSSTGGEASGPLSFIKIFDTTTNNIKQGGKRRGANMGILNVDHPDIETFIASKREIEVLANFNISVGIYDGFIEAVEKEGLWTLRHPATGRPVKKVKALKLWKAIIENAWMTGDPGLIFLDTIESKNPTPAVGRIACTNPCGEVPLLPYEPCNLGSVNLTKMLSQKGSLFEINWELLKKTVDTSVRFLDNVIDVNKYVIPEIETLAKGNRKIGLGVMGWAEMLIKLKIPYDSEDAVKLGEKLMKFINDEALKASVELAAKRGTFKNWEKSNYYPRTPVRNATRTSIAPTGTISIIANTSSSIEPLFALAYKREKVLKGETLTEINPLLREFTDEYITKEKLFIHIMETGDLSGIEGLPENIKRLFPTSLEIPYRYHILHQIAFQKYTDNAVSKTINLPEEASMEDVSNAYMMAWKRKAKGITIFRSGSKGAQVLSKGIKEVEEKPSLESCRVCIV